MSQVNFSIGDVRAVANAARGDVVTVGLSGPEIQELTQAAAAGAVGPLADKIVDLGHRLGVTQNAAITLLRLLSDDEVPIERLPDALANAATQIITMRQALSRPSNDESGIIDLRQQAVFALDAGEFEKATHLLNVIRAREQEASERRRRVAEKSHADWLGGLQVEAETCALLAGAALAQQDISGAQARFEDGLQVLALVGPDSLWLYALNAAAALYDLGEREGLNEALEAAIRFARQALVHVTRDRMPLQWAQTQNNLGNALRALGERESETTRLEEAVAAYRAALQERTRERVPVQWAETQNNLGNALRALGERESGTARLEEAVAAYRAALEERTRERVPLQWAETQNNLGIALATLGARETGTARLEEAVAAYRSALEERTRERVPLQWAETQNNLGNALATFGRARDRNGTAGGGGRGLPRRAQWI
jgi:tetratricopeptide (TPR) repeat protein